MARKLQPGLIMKKYILFLFLFVLISGCKRPQAPEFKYINDIELETQNDGKTILKGVAVFYNPNKMKLTLLDGEIEVTIDGNYISTIQEEYDMELDPESDFSVPLELPVSPNKMKSSLISSALGILTGKKLKIGYKGDIRLKAYGIPVKVPIDDEQEIDMKLW